MKRLACFFWFSLWKIWPALYLTDSADRVSWSYYESVSILKKGIRFRYFLVSWAPFLMIFSKALLKSHRSMYQTSHLVKHLTETYRG